MWPERAACYLGEVEDLGDLPTRRDALARAQRLSGRGRPGRHDGRLSSKLTSRRFRPDVGDHAHRHHHRGEREHERAPGNVHALSPGARRYGLTDPAPGAVPRGDAAADGSPFVSQIALALGPAAIVLSRRQPSKMPANQTVGPIGDMSYAANFSRRVAKDESGRRSRFSRLFARNSRTRYVAE